MSELSLVPATALRRWLGDPQWNDCLRRALLEVTSDGDFVTLAEGDAFTEQELVDAIRLYMDGARRPSFHLAALRRVGARSTR